MPEENGVATQHVEPARLGINSYHYSSADEIPAKTVIVFILTFN